MKIRFPFSLACIFLLNCTNSHAQSQRKEQDFDVNYIESRVPEYQLPAILQLAEGKEVQNPEEWHCERRPQILSLFSNLIYGVVPVPEFPIRVNSEVIDETDFLDGRCTRKIIRIQFENQRGAAEMQVLMFVPKEKKEAAPAFLMLNFDAVDSEKMQMASGESAMLESGIPLGKLIDQGYALISVYQQDLVGHNESEFKNSIHQLFFREGQSYPKANEWGVISAISWSATKALDYLINDPDIDGERVALLGHSKLGKAALWAAAQDERFAMVFSVQSGCAGAALWRRKFGETLAKMSIFPNWLCTNARKFIHQEDDLPVDQHMLMGLIAPRPLYVASAIDDHWADPRGEYLSAYHASAVYEMLGKRGLISKSTPAVGQPLITQDLGYHIRAGGHRVEAYDWEQFIGFANYHFKQ